MTEGACSVNPIEEIVKITVFSGRIPEGAKMSNRWNSAYNGLSDSFKHFKNKRDNHVFIYAGSPPPLKGWKCEKREDEMKRWISPITCRLCLAAIISPSAKVSWQTQGPVSLLTDSEISRV